MKNYYRIMLGKKSVYAKEAHEGGYIGAGFLRDIDLSSYLRSDLRTFINKVAPLFLAQDPTRTKISVGLFSGMLWNITVGIKNGDVVLCPDGEGSYYVGEVTGPYEYHKNRNLPHCRAVRWFSGSIARSEMSEALRNSTGSIGTVSKITGHSTEIEALVSGDRQRQLSGESANTIEDPSVFALEKHLEDFLVQNWKSTELGKNYDIYEEDGDPAAGKQYETDTGPMDILAVSKDKKELLVVELKKGRVSDVVVGQIQRYMGYVKEVLAEEGQIVKGIIIGFEDDIRIRRALSVAQNIEFFTYKVQFQLEKKK